MVHDLRKGIPFESESVDVVYHSHLLEHLDRDVAERFLIEAKRVLKPGGIQRIVVPDFEKLARGYIAHLARCAEEPNEHARHEIYIAAMIEQSVRRESRGPSEQSPLRRRIENVLLGDARRRGETHQWMYDRISLGTLLVRLGFRDPRVHQYHSSGVAGWNRYGLDVDEQGRQYKLESLYLEVER